MTIGYYLAKNSELFLPAILAVPYLEIGDAPSWLSVISDMGFPIVVSVFLLIVLNRTLEKQRLAMMELTIELRVGQKIIMNKLDAEEEFEAELAKENQEGHFSSTHIKLISVWLDWMGLKYFSSYPKSR